ncbi:sensor histidine kinase [Synoicihabitans lomoniglobus]|uniref:Histidine kinase n=1 Tax=Synoicihabitans lomoniglobus TaxID=2909285 RepID=A0AAE9ZT84_9BACT|nr:histidine kinase [Opitutaceae bacterium LMO-M01]WED63841.1 histidine kinase [Opitutaceae bacterium LMO-M01]
MPPAPVPVPSSSPSSRDAGRRTEWRITALLIAVSLVVGIAFTWPLLRFIDVDAGVAATLVAVGWSPWAFLAVIIIALARVAPLDHDRWRRTLPIHLAACATLALGGYLSSDWIRETRIHNWPRLTPTRPARMVSLSSETVSRPRTEVSPAPATERAPEAFASGPRGGPSWPPERTATGETRAFVDGRHMRFFSGEFPEPDPQSLAVVMTIRSLGSGLIVPFYILLLAVAQAMRNHRRALDTAQAAAESTHLLTQARLQALQSQLQPHFLFNTLNAITSYISTAPRQAEEMVCALSDLLRRVLTLSQQHEVTLTEELELVDLYLCIQRHRFGDRLDFAPHIDRRLLDAAVPPLVLQPIVENAIVHGLDRATTPGKIELRAEQIGDQLRLTLIDHHRSTTTAKAGSSRPGVGLANVRNRLATLYGDAASLHAQPRTEGGYFTEINLPLHPCHDPTCESS